MPDIIQITVDSFYIVQLRIRGITVILQSLSPGKQPVLCKNLILRKPLIYSLRDLPELLQAVCDYYERRFQVEITPDMVMSVYGSQEGMGHLGMALCDEGDVGLLPDPCYPVFAAGSLMGGAVPYYYPLVAEHDFLPYVKDIPEEVAKKAKYMVVSLPSNPVGSIATPGLYEEIVAFAQKYDMIESSKFT